MANGHPNDEVTKKLCEASFGDPLMIQDMRASAHFACPEEDVFNSKRELKQLIVFNGEWGRNGLSILLLCV